VKFSIKKRGHETMIILRGSLERSFSSIFSLEKEDTLKTVTSLNGTYIQEFQKRILLLGENSFGLAPHYPGTKRYEGS